MPLAETVFRNAIKHWWASKEINTGGITKAQGGTRDGNLRGDTMDGFRDVIVAHLVEIGVKQEDIFVGGQLSALAYNLPSYFRASKNWDVIVCKQSFYKRLQGLVPSDSEPLLVAAVEFKSQEGSIGNNQNNRIEESIGNAADFWASYENKNFIHLTPRPWLGYLFVGRYTPEEAVKRVTINQPHFPTDKIFDGEDPAHRTTSIKFRGPSYAERYRIFLERMIAKKMYDGACLVTTHDGIKSEPQNYDCLFSELSGDKFIDGLTRHVKAYYF